MNAPATTPAPSVAASTPGGKEAERLAQIRLDVAACTGMSDAEADRAWLLQAHDVLRDEVARLKVPFGNLPAGIALLSDEKRSELRGAAEAIAAITTGPARWAAEAGHLAKLLPVEVVLGTLSYLEWLEGRVRYLTDTTVSQAVYSATSDRYEAELVAARTELAALREAGAATETKFQLLRDAFAAETGKPAPFAPTPAASPVAGGPPALGEPESERQWLKEMFPNKCTCQVAPPDYVPTDTICRRCNLPLSFLPAAPTSKEQGREEVTDEC